MPTDLFAQQESSAPQNEPRDLLADQNNSVKPFFMTNTDPNQTLINSLPKNDGGWGNAAVQAASTLGMLAIPELGAPEIIGNAISKLPGALPEVTNYLGRTAVGTGLNAGSQGINALNGNNLNNDFMMNAILEGVAPGAGAIGQGLKVIGEPFMPQQFANKMMGDLGQGSKNLEDNAQSLANDIYNGYQQRTKEVNSIFDPITQQYGTQSIYPFKNPTGISQAGFTKQPDLSEVGGDLKVGNMFKDFNNNPTFNNAHELQSQLGVQIGKLQRAPTSLENSSNISGLTDVRNKILGDMDNFLRDEKGDDQAANQYDLGSEMFKQNVVPYRSDNNLADIAKGQETNPKNIHNIFEYPSNTRSKDADIQMGAINKVMQDLPASAAGKILYSKIGSLGNSPDPEKLLSALQAAKTNGYSSYLTPAIDNQMSALGSKVANKTLATRGIGGAIGMLGGRMFGMPGIEAGTALGAYIAPKVANELMNIPGGQTASTLSKDALTKLYKPIIRLGTNALISSNS